jgi:hypothetical protein
MYNYHVVKMVVYLHHHVDQVHNYLLLILYANNVYLVLINLLMVIHVVLIVQQTLIIQIG